MWPELKNALSWFAAAPQRWIDSAEKDLSAAAEWLMNVIEGDFAKEQSTAQVITGTVISMIPFVDQLCDVRDLVANCRKIKQDSDNTWAWVALVLTLLGLFPTLGSLAKGCFKILFAYGRRGMLKVGTKALETGLWKETKPWVEQGIKKLNEFLARPAVRKTLAALKIDNVYKYLADLARKLAGEANAGALLKAMDGVIEALQKLVHLVQKWGTAAMKTRAGRLLQSVKEVRELANRKLAEVLKPVQEWLDHLARRLEIEADQNYRAVTNAVNPHAFNKPTLDAELAELRKNQPAWVDKGPGEKFKAMKESTPTPDWPDISASSKEPTRAAINTFHTAEPIAIAPGTVLYRIVDPGAKSFDNSICWMSKAEFDKLRSKDDWRRRFAVWANWNSNGEFVTYTVPPGKPLHAWQGVTASQVLNRGEFVAEGGAIQIVLDPKDLEKSFLGKREPTGWGYRNFGETPEMIGVPVLTNNWRD